MGWWKTQTQRRTPAVLTGPLFGGHSRGDFSLRPAPKVDKPLPPVPKKVTFGPAPPAWEFYKSEPAEDNTANTRYCPW
ncbi:hypothetical protein Q5752_001140 [Cryptotrichosporon argae]